MHASGMTRKKIVLRAKQRSELLRAQYLIDVSVYKGYLELFVFIDETGSDQRDCMRKFGYMQPKRKACYCSKIADTFEDFIINSLASNLQPFNGTNSNSVVVLDNCSIHFFPFLFQSQEMTLLTNFKNGKKC